MFAKTFVKNTTFYIRAKLNQLWHICSCLSGTFSGVTLMRRIFTSPMHIWNYREPAWLSSFLKYSLSEQTFSLTQKAGKVGRLFIVFSFTIVSTMESSDAGLVPGRSAVWKGKPEKEPEWKQRKFFIGENFWLVIIWLDTCHSLMSLLIWVFVQLPTLCKHVSVSEAVVICHG